MPIYLFGGTEEVLDQLNARLMQRYPDLKIAGSYAPPFRPLTPHEENQVVDDIRSSDARIVFIGLGCPKQDLFAYKLRNQISAVQICVGAAFDFHAGVKRMAPKWMQSRGLEWLYRLSQEPSRLWLRYLTTNSLFVLKLIPFLLKNRMLGSSQRILSTGEKDG
ncbi:MAG: WecB/TagA/CpsF family glycosyltransferase [Planctomycetota bacterium]